MIGHKSFAMTIRVVAIVVVAVAVGTAVAFGAAWLGHQFLVITVGEEGIPSIDDTPLMLALVVGAYLSAGIAGLTVAAYGWRRFVRRRA